MARGTVRSRSALCVKDTEDCLPSTSLEDGRLNGPYELALIINPFLFRTDAKDATSFRIFAYTHKKLDWVHQPTSLQDQNALSTTVATPSGYNSSVEW